MILLHMYVNKELSEPDCRRLNMAYDRFINQIQHISKQENQSKLDPLHTLVRKRLARLLDSCDDRKSIQYPLIKSALSLIEFGPLSAAGFFCLYDDLRHRSYRSSGNSKLCTIPESKILTTADGPF